MPRATRPRPSRPRAARMAPAARRAQLVASALQAFARRGLGATRHADVATTAGVSLPAVFVYFPTRDRLVDAVLDDVERHYLRLVADVTRRRLPVRESLREVAHAFAAAVATHPDHARVWLDWSTAIRDDLWPRYLRFQARVLRRLAGEVRRGQRDGTIAPRLAADDAALLLYTAAYPVVQLALRGASAGRIARFLDALVASVAPPP